MANYVKDEEAPLNTVAYMFAGLAMMLNIRLSYSAAPYALLRFKLPENLFSVFVRTTSSALELWCIPSMTIGNIMEQAYNKQYMKDDQGKPATTTATDVKKWSQIVIPSMVTNWLNFLTFVILLIVYVTGGDNGHITGYYWVMAISGFVFGINMVLVYAVDYRYLPYYIAGENSFLIVTSLIHYLKLIFGNRRKYNSEFLIVVFQILSSIVITVMTARMRSVSGSV